VVVLCYHSVHPQRPIATVSPQLFEEHLAWLSENCDVVPFSRAADAARAAGRIRPTVSITFDDGYEDNFTYAVPLLLKSQLPATFFVTAGLADKDDQVLERFRSFYGVSTDDVTPMGWSELREMAQSGFEIGAHTYSHPNLARLAKADVEDELARSKQVIEEQVERPVTVMAYPFGLPRAHVNRDVIVAARSAGYRSAAAVLYRPIRPDDDPLVVPRFFVKRDDVATLRLKVLGGFDVIAAWQTRAPLRLGRLVSPEYFGSGDWARRHAWGNSD
jgi:peptidoglycan/xylan/chitin deacetylase (PgdA/CDA1 family)